MPSFDDRVAALERELAASRERWRVAEAGEHLTITDSGPGFDHASVRGRGGLGIISMQEHAHLTGRSLSSRPGEGTTIDVRVSATPNQG